MLSTNRHEVARDRFESAGVVPSKLGTGGTEDFDRVDNELALRGALQALRPDDRDLILLVAWEELDAAGAAQVLGIGVTAARVRLHRARRRLAASIAKSTLYGPEALAGLGPQ